jgi:cyclin-dependent kinase 12/13
MIGQGTYGKVFLAKDKRTGEHVAAKKVIMDTSEKSEKKEEGFPITAIREIKLLLDLDHPNIICLKEVVRSQPHATNSSMGSIYMIFDYMDHDLDGLSKQLLDMPPRGFTEPQVRLREGPAASPPGRKTRVSLYSITLLYLQLFLLLDD